MGRKNNRSVSVTMCHYLISIKSGWFASPDKRAQLTEKWFVSYHYQSRSSFANADKSWQMAEKTVQNHGISLRSIPPLQSAFKDNLSLNRKIYSLYTFLRNPVHYIFIISPHLLMQSSRPKMFCSPLWDENLTFLMRFPSLQLFNSSFTEQTLSHRPPVTHTDSKNR
jgi:hypothetical protein